MTNATSRAPGTPRTRPPIPVLRGSVTDSITESVLHELAEVGYGRLTMENVAKRAGSSKATLYRRWPSKQEMVLDAVATASRPALPGAIDADLRGHLRKLVRSVYDWLSEPLMRLILPDLLAEGLRSGVLDQALTQHIGEPRRRTTASVMAAAKRDGVVRPDADIEFALDLIAAPIYWRLCVLRTDVDEDYLEQVVDLTYRQLSAKDA